MINRNIYVDYHVLQTLPPSCVNRDDAGSPKTAVFGGQTRARVSSQAWKRAMREMFKEIFQEEKLSCRTRNVKALLAKKILESDDGISEEEAGSKRRRAYIYRIFLSDFARQRLLASLG